MILDLFQKQDRSNKTITKARTAARMPEMGISFLLFACGAVDKEFLKLFVAPEESDMLIAISSNCVEGPFTMLIRPEESEISQS